MASRRRNQEAKKTNGTNFISFIPWLLGLIVIGMIVMYLAIQPAPVDPITFCPKDENEQGTVVILVDVSDAIRDSQKARLENELNNISTQSESRTETILKKGDRLVVYFLEEEPNSPKKVFDLCNPGDVKNRTLNDKLSEGRIFAQKKWDKFSSDIIKTVNQKISSTSTMNNSPIIEAVKFVRATEFPPPNVISPSKNYKLLIWSDMIQNSKLENHFKSLGKINETFKKIPTDLKGIETIIFHIMSEKYSKYQTNEQVFWWRQFFSKAKANLDWKVL